MRRKSRLTSIAFNAKRTTARRVTRRHDRQSRRAQGLRWPLAVGQITTVSLWALPAIHKSQLNKLRFGCQVAAGLLPSAYSQAIRPTTHNQGRRDNMTIVSLLTIHPNPGVKWDDLQKQLKKGCDLAREHGAENVTVLATMIGGTATNTISLLSTAEDWAR